MADRDEEIIAPLRRGYDAFNRGDFDAAMEMIPSRGRVRPSRQPIVA
jgi:hypothetical protein